VSTSASVDLTVILPVYIGADPAHFRQALESVYAQTYPATEIIVVEDGPLADDHRAVLDEFADRDPIPTRVSLPENKGVAEAVQTGLDSARSEWIARVDADDINEPDRFARQVAAIIADDWDLVGSAMTEFDDRSGRVLGVRSMPTDPEAIARIMRANNAFNHPTVVFRRESALTVGGYRPVPYMEDYDLFARMLAAGARATNLVDPLVRFRGGDAMLARRRTPGIFRAEIRMQRNLRAYGLISAPRALINLVLRTAYRLLPTPALRLANRVLFHRD